MIKFKRKKLHPQSVLGAIRMANQALKSLSLAIDRIPIEKRAEASEYAYLVDKLEEWKVIRQAIDSFTVDVHPRQQCLVTQNLDLQKELTEARNTIELLKFQLNTTCETISSTQIVEEQKDAPLQANPYARSV